MKQPNRRKRFLIQKPLQFHYLVYFVSALMIVSAAGITGTYFGVWTSIVKTFSEESLQDTMMTAAQIHEYEEARRPKVQELQPTVRHFRETRLLSARHKETIREILDRTHRELVSLGIGLLVLIGWGSIFLTHKVAGPIFRLIRSFDAVKEGDLRLRIKLRKFDEAGEAADHFNEMTAAMDEKISRLKHLARENSPDSFEQIKRELSKFKTTSNAL